MSAVSITVYWKTRALVETLDSRGTPELVPMPRFFATPHVFVFPLGHAEVSLHHSQYCILVIFFLSVSNLLLLPIPSKKQNVQSCELKLCVADVPPSVRTETKERAC